MVTMDVDGRCKKWSDVSLYLDMFFCSHRNGKGIASATSRCSYTYSPCVTELVL